MTAESAQPGVASPAEALGGAPTAGGTQRAGGRSGRSSKRAARYLLDILWQNSSHS